MATIGELTDDILDILQEPSYDAIAILGQLNKAMLYVAATVRLPGLETMSPVNTVADSAYCDLPADYFYGLFRAVESINGHCIEVLHNRAWMLSTYLGKLDNTGPVQHICRAGMQLLYQPIPAEAEEIHLYYYRRPDPFTQDGDVPDVLPVQFHDLLAIIACRELFARIEDGAEGPKANTAYYQMQAKDRLEELRAFLKEGVSYPAPAVVRGEFL